MFSERSIHFQFLANDPCTHPKAVEAKDTVSIKNTLPDRIRLDSVLIKNPSHRFWKAVIKCKWPRHSLCWLFCISRYWFIFKVLKAWVKQMAFADLSQFWEIIPDTYIRIHDKRIVSTICTLNKISLNKIKRYIDVRTSCMHVFQRIFALLLNNFSICFNEFSSLFPSARQGLIDSYSRWRSHSICTKQVKYMQLHAIKIAILDIITVKYKYRCIRTCVH